MLAKELFDYNSQ